MSGIIVVGCQLSVKTQTKDCGIVGAGVAIATLEKIKNGFYYA